jgi:hypothetical protein
MLQVAPIGALAFIAIINLVLVFQFDLSTWHGGGFGMFSSVDHHTSRFIRVMARTPRGIKIIDLGEYTAEVETLKNLPTPARLSSFLTKLACTTDLPPQTSSLTLSYYKLDFTRNPLQAELKWEGRTDVCR